MTSLGFRLSVWSRWTERVEFFVDLGMRVVQGVDFGVQTPMGTDRFTKPFPGDEQSQNGDDGLGGDVRPDPTVRPVEKLPQDMHG